MKDSGFDRDGQQRQTRSNLYRVGRVYLDRFSKVSTWLAVAVILLLLSQIIIALWPMLKGGA